uniref:Ovule protein n=1 Tax=Syphacia muris TaxID=451379 RepID=A0A0N5A895_9BILA
MKKGGVCWIPIGQPGTRIIRDESMDRRVATFSFECCGCTEAVIYSSGPSDYSSVVKFFICDSVSPFYSNRTT